MSTNEIITALNERKQLIGRVWQIISDLAGSLKVQTKLEEASINTSDVAEILGSLKDLMSDPLLDLAIEMVNANNDYHNRDKVLVLVDRIGQQNKMMRFYLNIANVALKGAVADM